MFASQSRASRIMAAEFRGDFSFFYPRSCVGLLLYSKNMFCFFCFPEDKIVHQCDCKDLNEDKWCRKWTEGYFGVTCK